MLTRYREIVPRLRLAGAASIYLRPMYSIQHSRKSTNLFLTHLFCPHLMAGPTSFAPIIEMAITIVEQSGGQYHVLVIIADGQVIHHCFRVL